MKAIIGIDSGGSYEPAVRLFARLKLANPDTTLINVADLVLPYTSFGVPPTMQATNEFVEGLREAGRHAVAEAKAIYAEYGGEAKTQVVSGPAVLTLLDEADRIDADVVAVASTRKGALATLFTGSMSRSIVSSCKHSVLIAKEGVRKEGPVKVVLATDHSPYADRAIDRFLQLAPKGISKIHVVTAYEVSDKEAELLHIDVPNFSGDILEWIAARLAEKSQALVGKLSQHGYTADYTLLKGDPNHVIETEMSRTGSELLVVGAQGHGFFDRVFVGSVSFHQVVAEPYSVFVIRAD